MKIHVQIQGKKFTVKVGDIQSRPIKTEVDGEIFEVWPQESIVPGEGQIAVNNPEPDHPQSPSIQFSQGDKTPAAQTSSVQAPIPGVIIEVMVKPGENVNYGQELCVLEAMKMKNSIRASRDAIIQEVFTKVGDHVHQGQQIIAFEQEGDE